MLRHQLEELRAALKQLVDELAQSLLTIGDAAEQLARLRALWIAGVFWFIVFLACTAPLNDAALPALGSFVLGVLAGCVIMSLED